MQCKKLQIEQRVSWVTFLGNAAWLSQFAQEQFKLVQHIKFDLKVKFILIKSMFIFSTFLLIWKMRSTTGIQMKYTQNFWFKKKDFFSIFNNSNLGLVVPKPLYHGLQFNKCTIFFIRRIPLGAGLSLCCQLRFQECLQSMYLDTKNIQWEMELAIPWLNSSKVIAVSSPIIVALDLQEEQPA